MSPYDKGVAEAWMSPCSRNPYDRGSDAEASWFVGRDAAVHARIEKLEFELRETLRAVLHYFGPDGAHKVTEHVIRAKKRSA